VEEEEEEEEEEGVEGGEKSVGKEIKAKQLTHFTFLGEGRRRTKRAYTFTSNISTIMKTKLSDY